MIATFTPVRPSIAALEQALYTYLNSDSNPYAASIRQYASVSPPFPEDKIDLVGMQGIVTIESIDDNQLRRSFPPIFASPIIRFNCYGATAPIARYLQEQIDNAIPYSSLTMDLQRVQAAQFYDSNGVRFESNSGLYIADISYKFHLAISYRAKLNPSLISGSGSIFLPLLSASATGLSQEFITATGSINLPSIGIIGNVSIGSDPIASGSIVLPVVTVTANGLVAHTATGSLNVPVTSISADGNVQKQTTATGSIDLPVVTITANGLIAHQATGSISLPTPIISGSGVASSEITASGSIDLPQLNVSSDGIAQSFITAVGSFAVPLQIISGTGSQGLSPIGNSSINLPAVVLAGSGNNQGNRTATGTINNPSLTMSGNGTITYTPSLRFNDSRNSQYAGLI